MVSLEIIEEFIKMFVINFCVFLLFYKITATKEKKFLIMFASVFGITVAYITLEYLNFDFTSRLIITGLIYSILLGAITKNLIHYSVIATLISYAITFIVNFMSIIIIYFLIGSMVNDTNAILYTIIIEVLTIALVCAFLRIKRFDNGLSFLKNNSKLEIMNVTVLVISIEIIMYSTILRKPIEELSDAEVFSFFVVTSIFMIILIFMSFRAYYKSIQTQKTIENLTSEIKIKDNKYDKLYKEHERVAKKLHETSHKVQSLAYSVNTNLGLENNDLANVIEELKENLNTNSAIDNDSLPKTNISNIDMMFNYMRSESLKSNIEFELKISDNITYMIEHLVDKNDLETMIADHIKDSIIAIKSKNAKNNNKILVSLGNFNKYYELSISDTGIDFEIDTLVNLGLKRTSTHLETGGNGIGFMSTFEVLKKCNGSLAIAEFIPKENENYSKTVSIIFDNKNEYHIYSYRKEEIRKADKNNRIIL